MQYVVRINRDPDSDYGASVPDLPGCVATGKTIDSALRRIERAIESTYARCEKTDSWFPVHGTAPSRLDASRGRSTVTPRSKSRRNLHQTAIDAAARASFECRGCTQPSTTHTIAFVFSLAGLDSAGNPLPPAWKQTGDASSEVTVFGRVPIVSGGGPSKPFHVRAARCLWLWHCSKQAYVRPTM
jgi:predicted RNase H-like HicB family nuclease